MAISASAKSRAAAVSALIKRDAGFFTESSANYKHQTGIKIYAGDDLVDGGWPRLYLSWFGDPNIEADQREAKRKVEYRRYNITKSLDKRGYLYEQEWVDEGRVDEFGYCCCRIRVTGKAPKGQKVVDGRVEQVVEVRLQFTIDPVAAARYLGWEDGRRFTWDEVAAAMADSIPDMIEASQAYQKGALQVTRNELMK